MDFAGLSLGHPVRVLPDDIGADDSAHQEPGRPRVGPARQQEGSRAACLEGSGVGEQVIPGLRNLDASFFKCDRVEVDSGENERTVRQAVLFAAHGVEALGAVQSLEVGSLVRQQGSRLDEVRQRSIPQDIGKLTTREELLRVPLAVQSRRVEKLDRDVRVLLLNVGDGGLPHLLRHVGAGECEEAELNFAAGGGFGRRTPRQCKCNDGHGHSHGHGLSVTIHQNSFGLSARCPCPPTGRRKFSIDAVGSGC